MTLQTSPLTNIDVPDLPAGDRATLNMLVQRVREKAGRNLLRRRYYDGHNRLKDLGISIPPTLTDLEVVVGWPAKAVDSMSRRTILEGFQSASANADDLGVSEIWDGNRLDSEAPASHTSSLMHSVSFVSTTAGDVLAGQPAAIIRARSAEWAAAEWDPVMRCLSAAVLVLAVDPLTREATEVEFHVPGVAYSIRVVEGRWQTVNVSTYRSWEPGVPIEPLPYRSALDRPFGRSRISRGVMYFTDAAVRTMLRTEVGAEFYNAPQRYALGADEDAFKDKAGNLVPAWQVMLGRLLTLSRDEEGELPTVGQFAQQSMQPNIEQLRSIATMFAAETSLPVGSLGIVQDNPSSAEAITAANEELGIEIEHWRRTSLSPGWRRVMKRALVIANHQGGAVPTATELRAYGSVVPQWGSWSAPSEASQAQASLARVQAIPRLAETDVELERMYTRDEVDRIKAQWARSASRANLAALAPPPAPAPAPPTPTPEPAGA